MAGTSLELDQLREQIDAFSELRDWRQYHTPKNLSMALSVETSELMEIFQWLDSSTSFADLPEKKQVAVKQEVGDIFIYLMRFCSVTGIDPLVAASDKLEINDEKYPADKVRGRSDKYSDY